MQLTNFLKQLFVFVLISSTVTPNVSQKNEIMPRVHLIYERIINPHFYTGLSVSLIKDLMHVLVENDQAQNNAFVARGCVKVFEDHPKRYRPLLHYFYDQMNDVARGEKNFKMKMFRKLFESLEAERAMDLSEKKSLCRSIQYKRTDQSEQVKNILLQGKYFGYHRIPEKCRNPVIFGFVSGHPKLVPRGFYRRMNKASRRKCDKYIRFFHHQP